MDCRWIYIVGAFDKLFSKKDKKKSEPEQAAVQPPAPATHEGITLETPEKRRWAARQEQPAASFHEAIARPSDGKEAMVSP